MLSVSRTYDAGLAQAESASSSRWTFRLRLELCPVAEHLEFDRDPVARALR